MTRLATRRLLASLATTTILMASLVSLSTLGANAGASTKHDSIVIKNFMFMPMTLKVEPGATISVTNKDSTTHTLTSTTGKFNTGDIKAHATKTFKAPVKPGTYHYMCNIHQYMTGSIVVK